MSVPQLIMVLYLSVMLFGGLVLNGKPKTGKYEFGVIFTEMLLLFVVLYAGGFWN